MRIGYAKDVTEDAFADAGVERAYIDGDGGDLMLTALIEMGLRAGQGDVVVLLRSGDVRGVQRQHIEAVATVEIHEPATEPVKPGRPAKTEPTDAMRAIWLNQAYSTRGAIDMIRAHHCPDFNRHNGYDWFGKRS